jgi:acetyl-CoA decarbonylase/synthase complex subunit alpha
MCIRPNDTTKGRAIKLTHYIDLHEKYFGTLPDDWHFFVRNKMDLPVVKKEMLSKELEKMGWKQRVIPDPTLLERFKGGWK